MDEVLRLAQAHVLLLALLLPIAFRIAGHWIPEEPLMVLVGVLAARAGGAEAAAILFLMWAGHFITDQVVFALGRTVAPRLARWPRVERRIAAVAERVADSAWALAAFVPARVLPLGRGIWLLGLGVAAVPRARFVLVDALALALHVGVWCGLGWWLGPHLDEVPQLARTAALWVLVAAVAVAVVIMLRRRMLGGAEEVLGS